MAMVHHALRPDTTPALLRLDGAAQRRRRRMFLRILGRLSTLREQAEQNRAEWEAAAERWERALRPEANARGNEG